MTAFLVVVHAWKKTQCGNLRMNLPLGYHVKYGNVWNLTYLMVKIELLVKCEWKNIFKFPHCAKREEGCCVEELTSSSTMALSVGLPKTKTYGM